MTRSRAARLSGYDSPVNIRSITSSLKKRYAREDALPVDIDIDALIKLGLKVMPGSLAQTMLRRNTNACVGPGVAWKTPRGTFHFLR